jgi:hypothetical protein
MHAAGVSGDKHAAGVALARPATYTTSGFLLWLHSADGTTAVTWQMHGLLLCMQWHACPLPADVQFDLAAGDDLRIDNCPQLHDLKGLENLEVGHGAAAWHCH